MRGLDVPLLQYGKQVAPAPVNHETGGHIGEEKHENKRQRFHHLGLYGVGRRRGLQLGHEERDAV